MTESTAAAKADKLIELLITHQPALFGTANSLTGDKDAEHVAQTLATLRQHLIAKLTPQTA